MNRLLFAVLMGVSISATAVEVVAVGQGSTQAIALQQAKIEASNKVVGEFLIGTTTTDGNTVKDTISQYTGGFVRSYDLISVEMKGKLFEVTIKADVDQDKINTVAQSTGAAVPEHVQNAMKNASESSSKLHLAIQSLLADANKFVTTVTDVKYTIRGDVADATLNATISLSPKWYDDLRTLLKAAGKEIGISTDRDYGVCFVGKRAGWFKPIECYDAHEDLALPTDIPYSITATLDNGSMIEVISGYATPSQGIYHGGQYDSRMSGIVLYQDGTAAISVSFSQPTEQMGHVVSFNVVVLNY